MQNIIDDLNWRYATKRFDASKGIHEEQLEILKESLRLVPTSYGLQAMKFIIVENTSIRESLLDSSYGQKQVLDAPLLLVLCAYDDIEADDIDEYVNLIVAERGTPREELQGFRDGMIKSITNMSPEKKRIWLDNQVYIALGQLLQTCAILKLDATPMEGFKRDDYDEILQLKEKGLTSVLVCPIGFRHAEDKNQYRKKVRKKTSDVFITIN